MKRHEQDTSVIELELDIEIVCLCYAELYHNFWPFLASPPLPYLFSLDTKQSVRSHFRSNSICIMLQYFSVFYLVTTGSLNIEKQNMGKVLTSNPFGYLSLPCGANITFTYTNLTYNQHFKQKKSIFHHQPLSKVKGRG